MCCALSVHVLFLNGAGLIAVQNPSTKVSNKICHKFCWLYAVKSKDARSDKEKTTDGMHIPVLRPDFSVGKLRAEYIYSKRQLYSQTNGGW